MFLSHSEADAIKARVAGLEARTGVQVVTAVVAKSDSYAELPWRAFALGAALGGLAVVVAHGLRPQWITAATPLLTVTTVLGVGVTAALAAVFVPAFARLFLGATRRDVEVRQQAQSIVLDHGLFRTESHTAVLLLVSRFERSVVILPDTGFAGTMQDEDWTTVVTRMRPLLAEGALARALQEGLDALENRLTVRGVQSRGGTNSLPDHPIQEQGA